jgi:hypothetical protein
MGDVGKFHFGAISPTNGKSYAFKTVEAVFAEESTTIVV